MQHIVVVETHITGAGLQIDEGRETEAVGQLMEHHRDEVHRGCRPLAIEAVVEVGRAEHAGAVDIGVVARLDFLGGTIEIDLKADGRAGEVVGQRGRVEGIAHRRAGEIDMCGEWPSEAERGARAGAAHRVEIAGDFDHRFGTAIG